MSTIAEMIGPGLEARLRTAVEGPRCAQQGKIMLSKREAQRTAKRMRGQGRLGVEGRPWYCSACGSWHVASGTGRVRHR